MSASLVGSEMCIRDSTRSRRGPYGRPLWPQRSVGQLGREEGVRCLDERMLQCSMFRHLAESRAS
eukprot:4653487-Alexandrium_andersonii.AAC.1